MDVLTIIRMKKRYFITFESKKMRVYIGLGSNEGDRIAHLQFALKAIQQLGKIAACSSVYESEPWGFESTHGFLNAVVVVDIRLSPMELLVKIHKIEAEAGRVRNESLGYTDRTLDLDILYMDDLLLDSENLSVPHPAIAARKFVLLPLYEISPDWYDVRKQQTVKNLLQSCEDYSIVNKNISFSRSLKWY